MKILCEKTIIEFKTNFPVKESATKLRGCIAKHHRDIPQFHHHNGRKFDYSHPLIQYRIIDGRPMVIGLREGSILLQLIDNFSELKLGINTYQVLETQRETVPAKIGFHADQLSYSFLTPWLALNEKNYEQYQRLGTWAKKKELLEKILIGNIISMSKSLGYTVPEPIKANIIKLKEVNTRLKGTPMLGFLGTFSVNFEIPDYWGIGKSVSRGFGTIKRDKKD
jgi:hypothetical protein